MDFLDVVIRRNSNLVKVAVELHNEGAIPPNTFVIDLDAVEYNAEIIKREADKYKLTVYFMTKQFGRNPLVCRAIMKSGIRGAVANDIDEAKTLHRYGIPVSHLGHLVGIPKSEVKYVLSKIQPEVITVYDLENAEKISRVAKELGVRQKLLIRVVGKMDFFYNYQEGGIPEEYALDIATKINSLGNVEVVGVTTFPCKRFNIGKRKVEPLPNFDTMLRVSKILKENGINIEQINCPGDDCSATMELVASKGGTHVEPGHGFTGTTPWHAFEDLPETPAMIYITEVSHKFNERVFIFGGGLMSADAPLGIWDVLYHSYYIKALVGRDPDKIFDNIVLAKPGGYIDYYSELKVPNTLDIRVGDTVILAMRNQAFVSRAKVAIVKGIKSGKPELLGIFDNDGNLLDEDNRRLPLEKVFELMKRI